MGGICNQRALVWLIPVFVVVLALEYHAIVQWEEQLLELRHGNDRAYAALVPRWVPSLRNGPSLKKGSGEVASWRDTLFSERGTLMAIGVGYFLLWTKSQLYLMWSAKHSGERPRARSFISSTRSERLSSDLDEPWLDGS